MSTFLVSPARKSLANRAEESGVSSKGVTNPHREIERDIEREIEIERERE